MSSCEEREKPCLDASQSTKGMRICKSTQICKSDPNSNWIQALKKMRNIHPWAERYPSNDLAVRQVGKYLIMCVHLLHHNSHRHVHNLHEIHPWYQVVLHPDFYKPGVFNDVAVLLLSQAADTTQPHIGRYDKYPQNILETIKLYNGIININHYS